MDPDILAKVLKRLDILISLSLLHKSWSNSTDQDKIKFLDRFDLKPSEMADILDSTGDKISKQLYAIKSRENRTIK